MAAEGRLDNSQSVSCLSSLVVIGQDPIGTPVEFACGAHLHGHECNTGVFDARQRHGPLRPTGYQYDPVRLFTHGDHCHCACADRIECSSDKCATSQSCLSSCRHIDRHSLRHPDDQGPAKGSVGAAGLCAVRDQGARASAGERKARREGALPVDAGP